MKRNEKILVYAVTGFLAVVLAIAVFFGNDKLPGRQPKDLGDLMAAADTNAKNRSNSGSEQGAAGGSVAAKPADEGLGAVGEGLDGASEESEESGEATRGSQFVLDASSRRPELTPEDRLTMVMGASTVVDGQWRRVVVLQGDTLSGIAEKWCGTTSMMAEIRRLNEGVTDRMLTAGDRLLLPFVEAETLIQAHDARVAATATRGSAGYVPNGAAPAGQSSVGPTVAGFNYTVTNGDSAWRIAERHVSRNQAPRFIQELKRLNPHIPNIDTLKVGDKLRLPEAR